MGEIAAVNLKPDKAMQLQTYWQHKQIDIVQMQDRKW